MALNPREQQQAQDSLKKLERLLKEPRAVLGRDPTVTETQMWTQDAAKLRGELGMADETKAPITKAEVVNMIRYLREKEGVTDKTAIISRIKDMIAAPKRLRFDTGAQPPTQQVAQPTGRPIQSTPAPAPKPFAFPKEAEAVMQAASQPGIPPGSRVIRGGPAGGQIIMPPAPEKPTYEGQSVPEALKQIPGAAPAQAQSFEAPMGRFAAPGEAVPNLPSGAPAGGPPEVTPPHGPNLISDLVDQMISPGRMPSGELDLRPLATTVNSIILGTAGHNISAESLQGVLESPVFQNIVKSSPLAQKVMGFALTNDRILNAAASVGETVGAASPYMAQDMLNAPDTQEGFRQSLQTLGGFFAFDLAMRGAFTGLSRVYRDFAPYSALKPIQREAEQRAMDIINTAQTNAAAQKRALTPDERGAVLRYAAHAAASRIDEMVSPEFAEAYRQQLRIQLRGLMQQAEATGESPNTTFEVIQSILDARARNMNSAVQQSIQILNDSGLLKDMKVPTEVAQKAIVTAKTVSEKAKAAGRTVSAESTLLPNGKPFVAGSKEEVAAAQQAAQTAEQQVLAARETLPGTSAAKGAEEIPEPPKALDSVVTGDTVVTPEKGDALAQAARTPAEAKAEATRVVEAITSGKPTRRPKLAQQVGRFNLLAVEGGKMQMIDRVSGMKVGQPLDATTAKQAARMIDEGRVKIAGLPEKPAAPTPQVPTTNPQLAPADLAARAKADRLNLLKQRAAAIKGEQKVSAREAMEQAMVDESKPKVAEMKPEEELYAEILDSQSNRTVVDPLHSRTMRDFTATPPRTGPAVTYGSVRIMGDNLGYDLRAQRAADGGMEYILTPRPDGPRVAEEVVRTSSLSDMLAELQRKSGAFLSGEVANQTILADSPEDDEETRKTKTVLRNAIRLGTMGVLLGTVMPPSAARKFGGKVAGIARSIMTGLPVGSPDAGIWRRQSEELNRVASDVQHLWFGMRNPAEVIRNWPEELKNPVMTVDSAVRAMGHELDRWDHRLGVEAPRAGIGSKSDPSRWTYDIMEGVDSDIAAKIGNPRSKAAWHRAIAETFNRRPDEMAEATLRAVDAVDAMPERLLPWGKEFITSLRDLRQRSEANFVDKFTAGEGAEKPFVVRDDKGNVVRRTATAARAQQIVDRALSKQQKVYSFIQSAKPTPEEVEDRIGRTVSNYVTRLNRGLLEHDMRVEELVQHAPWSSPVAILDEMKRMLRISNKDQRRAAFESAFGVMDDQTYRETIQTALKATQSGGSVTGFRGAAIIPEDIYVRFYRNRTRSYDYERDAVDAMRTYTRSVLRDLYLDKHLPEFDKSVDAMVTQVQAGKLNPAAAMQVINYAEDVFKKNRSGTLPFAQTVGTLTNAMHGALLWARMKPAINNFVGQVFLVGIPQMVGEGYGDVMATASMAMWNPSVRRLLEQHDLIREAMPRGYRGFSEILDYFKNAETMRERVGAGKDAVKKALDFITTYTEVPMRTQAYLFGFMKYLKDNRALLQQIPGLGPNPPTKMGLDDLLKAVLAHRNLVPEDVWSAANQEGEKWIGRVCFFFEHESQPALMRAAKRIPVIGQPLTFLSNFPMTYMNRYVSTLLDAFGRNVPGATRRKAMGTILTHFGITMMLAGEAGFPLYSAFLENAAPEDPELPGKARRFLAPYAQFFATVFGHGLLGKVPGAGPVWNRRDLSVYGSTQPFTEFFNPRRYTDATLFRPALDAMKAFNPFADPQEAEDAKMRTFGYFAPLVGAPPPQQNLVPEVATTFMPGGTAANDLFNYLSANPSLPGPLDQRGRLKSTTNPLEKFIFGPTAEDREQRARVTTGTRARSEDERRVNRFVNALVNPNLLGTERGKKEMETALGLIRERPELIEGAVSSGRIEQAMRNLTMTPDVRVYFALPKATLQRIVFGTPQFPEGARILLKGIEKLPPEEQERRRQKFAAIMMAFMGAEPPPAEAQ